MHRDIYLAYFEARAVLHSHSTFATALSCLRLDIPAFHYMIAVAGGSDIRCADYALFGTQKLSDNMLEALFERRACLLGTHGMICYHEDLNKVLDLGIEVEALAKQYWHARQLGDQLRDAGFLVSFESSYLLARNWLQICLMGDFSRDKLEALVDSLRRLIGRPATLRAPTATSSA